MAKEKFEQNLDNIILENASNPKTYWKIMKMLIKSNKGSPGIPPLSNIINDERIPDMASEDEDKCNLLNKYFTSISNLNDQNVPLPDFEKRTNSEISDLHIEIDEIVDIIQVLVPNKASGPDSISHRMLKLCPRDIAPPLQIIFNKSLNTGQYPSTWKMANVIAIFKKGDASLPSNYRPISLISCVGKVLERIVFKYIYNHLNFNQLIYKYQSGFLPKYSTVHQLLEIYDCILNSLEQKELNCFVFCDFSKAFDKVWHRGLIHKMKAYGINGNLLKWFEHYLKSRKQKVVLNESASSLREVLAGVPQGSVLGPLLFVIYINDIARSLNSLCRLFADDTSFNYSGKDENHIKRIIDLDLRELDAWSKKWLMSFNPDKTEIMIFANTEIPALNFSLNNKNIPMTTCHKHLGVTFSNDGKWNNHVENIISSIKKHVNILRKLKYTLSRNNLEKLYLVFIRPIFEYACEVWDNCGKGNSERLEQLQLEAARIVTGLPIFTKTENLYREIGWQTLAERRRLRKLSMFYDIFHKNAPNFLNDIIPPCIQSTTNYPLRNGHDIIVPFCRLTLSSESFFPSTINQWNQLDPILRNVDSKQNFKSGLRNNKQNLPSYYSFGPRKLNIILTQLRCSASFINYDSFRCNIISDPSCSCGAEIENAKHFLFDCPLHTAQRQRLLNELNWLPENFIINVNLLTKGDAKLTNEQNILIFKASQDYIKASKRFLIV